MAALTALLVLAALFVGMQLAVALVNAATFPRLRPAARTVHEHEDAARVSLLLPVRDEIANLPATLPPLLAQGAGEVIVLDDGSSDGSGELLERAAARHPRLRLLRGAPLPAGWVGKSWACHQLAGAARGEILVFTDADVHWRPGTLAALLELRARHRADYVSVWPRQRTVTTAERIGVPLVDVILLGALPWPLVRALPFASLSAGNGQLMLFGRAAYDASGGHAAVRAELLEDVRLGQRAKRAGARVALALGGALIETRMYRGRAELIEGFAKNARAAAGGGAALALLALLNTLAYLLAWPLALADARWLLVALGGWALRAVTAANAGRDPREAPLQAFAPLLLWPVVARALAPGGVRWKGRRYS